MSRCEHGVPSHGDARCYQCWPIGLEDIDEALKPLNDRIAQLEESYRKLSQQHLALLKAFQERPR